MNIVLTPELISFLIEQGYRYCLIKTHECAKAVVPVTFVLTPVHERPCSSHLQPVHNALLNINEEPVWLSAGADDALVMMQLNRETLLRYVRHLLNPLGYGRRCHE